MGTILPSRLRSPFEHTGEAKVALFPRLPLFAEGSCLPQQTEGLPLRGTRWAGGASLPPLPPPLFIGRFAAFDRQIPKEDVFIPPNAAFAQLSLAHSAAFCYSFLNNRTRCGKRRLLP